MWQGIWTNLPRKEVPITHITNGVHTNTWISNEISDLFDRYLGDGWRDEPADHTIWNRVTQIPDAEIWRGHERRRERLVTFARSRLRRQLERNVATRKIINLADEVFRSRSVDNRFCKEICFLQKRQFNI
jgi:starch phosphorylase